MADQLIKMIEGKGASEVQVKTDAFLATLNAGYDILEISLCQAGSSLASERVVVAIKYIDGT